MADTKKWFKVWSTILIDPHHSNLSLEDVGRWTRLGAMIVATGDNGQIQIIPPAKAFLTAMNCPDLDSAKHALMRLPNVQIDVTHEEGISDNVSFTVIMQNWFKYQVDSTGYERLKRSRHKRRVEENKKRVEQEEIPPKSPKHFFKPTPQEISAYATSLGFRLDGQKFFDHYEARGWQYKSGQPMKNWQAAVRTWKSNNYGGLQNGSNGSQSFSSLTDIARRTAKDSELRKTDVQGFGPLLPSLRDNETHAKPSEKS